MEKGYSSTGEMIRHIKSEIEYCNQSLFISKYLPRKKKKKIRKEYTNIKEKLQIQLKSLIENYV